MARAHSDRIIERIGGESPPAYQDRWVRLYHDTVRFPDGNRGEYNRIVEGKTGKGVIAIPISDDGRLGFVRVYRYPISQHAWEFVRGYADSDDAAAEASRELTEEMGYSPEAIARAPQRSVGFLHPNSGVLSTFIEVYAFLGLPRRDGPVRLEQGIVTEVRFASHAEIQDWIRVGTLTDALSLASILHLIARGMFSPMVT